MSTKVAAIDIILEQLAKYGGRQKSDNGGRWVVCPFHRDNKPSLRINLVARGKYGIGTFNCFSCQEGHGGWNKFAQKVGLTQIKQWQLDQASEHISYSSEEEYALLGNDNDLERLMHSFRLELELSWDKHATWRGFDGEFLQEVGCRAVVDSKTDEVNLLCLVKVRGEVVGGVKAALVKKEGELSYITSKGAWVKAKGLFPYDYVRAMLKRTGLRYVVLVEGPRDALRLIRDGIPALAILGSLNFSHKKAVLVSSIVSNLKTVYLMGDNDAGGRMMMKIAKTELDQVCPKVVKVKLPRRHDDEDKLIPVDPCSAPKKLITKFKELAESQN